MLLPILGSFSCRNPTHLSLNTKCALGWSPHSKVSKPSFISRNFQISRQLFFFFFFFTHVAAVTSFDIYPRREMPQDTVLWHLQHLDVGAKLCHCACESVRVSMCVYRSRCIQVQLFRVATETSFECFALVKEAELERLRLSEIRPKALRWIEGPRKLQNKKFPAFYLFIYFFNRTPWDSPYTRSL